MSKFKRGDLVQVRRDFINTQPQSSQILADPHMPEMAGHRFIVDQLIKPRWTEMIFVQYPANSYLWDDAWLELIRPANPIPREGRVSTHRKIKIGYDRMVQLLEELDTHITPMMKGGMDFLDREEVERRVRNYSDGNPPEPYLMEVLTKFFEV